MSKQQTQGSRNWYAIHTYSGYENAVARNLKQRIESLGMEEKIFDVLVPTEKKIKIKGKFGYKTVNNISSGYLSLPSLIRSQAAVFATYLIGERKIGEKTKTSSETGNRVQSIGSGSIKNATVYAAPVAHNTQTSTLPEVYSTGYNAWVYGTSGIDKLAQAIKVPIERNVTETENTGMDGLIPIYEYKKLDSFRYLRI